MASPTPAPAPGADATERDATLALLCIREVGSRRIRQLVERFGSAAEAVRQPAAEFEALLGARFRPEPEFEWRRAAETVRQQCSALGARILFPGDQEWPWPPGAGPVCLFVKGRLGAGLRIGMVGTRRVDRFGAEMATGLARELSARGAVVVSGGAIGVDSRAHEGALPNPTWAVLGAGFRHLYPRENIGLFGRILDGGGALLTSQPPHMENKEGLFILRNQVLASLVQGLIVVQAPELSGALHTAREALRAGVPLFACAGSAFSEEHRGSLRLIRSGAARLVCTADDVLAGLGLHPRVEPFGDPGDPQLDVGMPPAGPPPVERMPAGLAPLAQRIWEALGAEGRDFEGLAAELELPVGELAPALTDLELRGLCRQRPGMVYVRARAV